MNNNTEQQQPIFYIDSPRIYPQKSKRITYAHLACFSSIQDLHAFAQNLLGLGRHWFHATPSPHYDVPGRKHRLALESGAVLVPSRELILGFRLSKFSKKIRVIGADCSSDATTQAEDAASPC